MGVTAAWSPCVYSRLCRDGSTASSGTYGNSPNSDCCIAEFQSSECPSHLKAGRIAVCLIQGIEQLQKLLYPSKLLICDEYDALSRQFGFVV